MANDTLENRIRLLEEGERWGRRVDPAISLGVDLHALGNVPTVRVTHSEAQTIGNSTTTPLSFDTTRFDTNSIHDNVTNNSRLTFHTAGVYQLTGNLRWDNNTTGRRIIFIVVNDATSIVNSEIHGPPITGHVVVINITTLYSFDIGDYAELKVHQTSGGDLDTVVTNNYTPEFMAVKVAEVGQL